MADVTYRANLKTSSFPFLSELWGRTVIVKQYDQNFVSGLAAKESIDSSVGVPQIYYLHNVIPTDNGYKSVGYDEIIPAGFGSSAKAQNALLIRDDVGNSGQLTYTATGYFRILLDGTTTWLVPGSAPSHTLVKDKVISTAYISGVTYIFVEGVGCYKYNFATNKFVSVTLLGLDVTKIICIASSKGYLLAFSSTSVVWSSTIDPTDFVPSLATGAGGGSVEGIKGDIVTAQQVYGGIIIFSEQNAVAAIASGNSRYPFNFVEITGAGGLQRGEYVSSEADSSSVYAYTTSGLQEISLRQAKIVFPEVTDFISGGLLEDYDESSATLELFGTSGTILVKKLAVIANRYLIISYGITELTHALYYDTAYKQWGRLKIKHTDCFEYFNPSLDIPKKSIAFLQSNGAIKVLDSDITSPNASGVLICGKYQFTRSRLMTLQEVEVENVLDTATFSCLDIPSLDGKTLGAPKTGYLQTKVRNLRVYKFRNTAINHSIVFKGAFNAVSLQLTFTVHGKR